MNSILDLPLTITRNGAEKTRSSELMKAENTGQNHNNAWQQRQDALADEAGLSVLLVDGPQPPALTVSNNNSICQVVQSSKTHAERCEPFCGKAFENAMKEGKPFNYRCHAGLYCVAAPLLAEPTERPLVAIVGRAFLRTADYRNLTERVWAGDWQNLPEDDLFENVLIAGSERELAEAAARLQNLKNGEARDLLELVERTPANPFSAPLKRTSLTDREADDLIQLTEREAETLRAQKPDFFKREQQSVASGGDCVDLDEILEIDLTPRAGALHPAPFEAGANGASDENNNSGWLTDIIEIETAEESVGAIEFNGEALIEIPAVTTGFADLPDEETVLESEPETMRRSSVAPAARSELAETVDDSRAWRKFANALLQHDYRKAMTATLRFLAQRYDLNSTAWLERDVYRFAPAVTMGRLNNVSFDIRFEPTDARLADAVERENSVRLEQSLNESSAAQTIEVFPIKTGDEIKTAVAVADPLESDAARRRVALFLSEIALSLEVVRLREEVSRRAAVISAVDRFNQAFKDADAESYFDTLARVPAEILNAERSSLLILDEAEGVLKPAAAFGNHADAVKSATPSAFGERVARQVLLGGETVVVRNVESAGLSPAPAGRDYRSNSFVSLPISVGNRRVGVLNVTEKTDGEEFDERDARLLEELAPQIAAVLDRANLQRKAEKSELASITDSLTGLLNRRYLEERLGEELRRSQRHGYPMSFMMIDVDNFKSYNDQFGHQAGDEALRLVADCLRAALRSADVAARYGGEEFSILLPQTTLSEAKLIAERIRRRVESTTFPHRAVTVSIGVAAYSQIFNTSPAVVEAADRALYEAKHNGKNNVQLSAHTNSAR